MVVTPEEEALQKATFEVTWTDEESGVAKKAKKVSDAFFNGHSSRLVVGRL